MATDFKALWRAKADGKEIQAQSRMPVPPGHPNTWVDMSYSTTTTAMCAGFFTGDDFAYAFRVKPETVMVNGHELPAPLTSEYRGKYWGVQLYGEPLHGDTAMDPGHTMKDSFDKGLCHATLEDAKRWTMALLDWRTCNGTK